MGLVPAVARVSRPPVLGVVALCGGCPHASQHHGSAFPRCRWYVHQHRAYSRYLGLCPSRRETLGLMAWKCCSPFSTMTLCEQLWRPIPVRAAFHLLVLD